MKKFGILILIALMGCGLAEVEPLSVVEGKVTVGPLCGIVPAGQASTTKSNNPCNISDAELDRIYGEYSVVIKDNKNNTISQKKLDRTGLFSFEVNEGAYLLNVESSVNNIILFNQKENLEKSITATKTQKQYLEFNINTGIR